MKYLSAMKFVDLPLIIYLMMKMKRDVSAANNKFFLYKKCIRIALMIVVGFWSLIVLNSK
jgi:hypothetical protein